MTETCGEFAQRMMIGRFHYCNDVRWLAGPDCYRKLAVTIFMVIKDRYVYKKLAGDVENCFADGQEIREAITGETHSYASYWLQRPEVRDAFKQLTDAGLVIKKIRNQGPYGYDDNEQYWLSTLGGVLITEAKTNDLIKLAVSNALIEQQTISGGSRGPFFGLVDLDEEGDIL